MEYRPDTNNTFALVQDSFFSENILDNESLDF
jgi:hypothetical protein